MSARLTRRGALSLLGTAGSLAVSTGASCASSFGAADFGALAAQAGGRPEDQTRKWKGSTLGNLYPFIKQEQQRTRQWLSYLNRKPRDLEAWKAEGRARVFDALGYHPEPCPLKATN